MNVEIDLKQLYGDTAKLSDLPAYIDQALAIAGKGTEVVLTGAAPVWLYLKIAHALHGKAKKLTYRSPVTGDVVIFDHDPF
ncbi:MAG: CRISPR-associated protein Csx3 [Gammaproteobacteria bacterium]